jgi:hypothetical protein
MPVERLAAVGDLAALAAGFHRLIEHELYVDGVYAQMTVWECMPR